MSVTFKFRFIKFVSKLWSKHNLTKYVVLKTLNQQAPPCYLLHLNSYELAAWNVSSFCSGYYIFWLVKLVKYIYLLSIVAGWLIIKYNAHLQNLWSTAVVSRHSPQRVVRLSQYDTQRVRYCQACHILYICCLLLHDPSSPPSGDVPPAWAW